MGSGRDWGTYEFGGITMHEESQGNVGESRRDFLKKAGAVAWVVPTLQVVNMASAAAGVVEGSMVTTTPPPSTSTTTTTTTKPPECTEYIYCTVKADWNGNGFAWSDGSLGAKACVEEQNNKCNGGAKGFEYSGDERSVTVYAPKGCYIMSAAHKAGSGDQDDYCTGAVIASDKMSATFSAERDDRMKDISNIQMVVKCCVDDIEN